MSDDRIPRETRACLLERIQRQKRFIQSLIAERDDFAAKAATVPLLRTEIAQLRETVRSLVSTPGSAAQLADLVRRFREAIRDKATGELIGGAVRRRILADVDDDAVAALSAIGEGAAR